MASGPSRPSTAIRVSRTAWLALAATIGYAIGAELAWGLFGATVGLAFFPPAGITFAGFVLVRGRRRLVLVALVMAVEYAVDVRHGLRPLTAIGYAAANVVEPLVGATVALRAVGADALRHLDDRRGMGGFVVGGLFAGPVVASLLGASVKVLDDPSASWWVSALSFWAGDGLGVLVVGAPLLLASRWRWRQLRQRPVEASFNVSVTVAASVVVFWFVRLPVMYLVLLPLVWAAFRMDALKLAIDGLVVAVVAIVATAHARGPFAAIVDASDQAKLTAAKLFLATTLLVAWFFLIGARERERIRERVARGEAEHGALELLRDSVLLPDRHEFPGVRTFARYRPAQDLFALGGDWYDVVELPSGALVLVVGDVVGGGLSAGVTMAQLRSGMRAIAPRLAPCEILMQMDAFVDAVSGGFGATAACLRLEPETGRFDVALAGHPPPVIRRSAGTAEVFGVPPGPPLGVRGPRSDTSGTLMAGDTVLLYTDGLVERRGERLDKGILRLTQAFEVADQEQPSWPDELIGDCLAGGDPQRDDIATLACQRV